jgi:RimJ/RimL family protein N-acetyltransferase
VLRHLTGGRPIPAAEVRDELLPRYLEADEFGTWAAESLDDATFLGWFALAPGPDSPPGEVELGYRLRRTAWGHGHATEGAAALVRAAFTELDVQRVFGTTMTVNTASRRVMAKVGLRHVRTFFLDWPDQIPGGELGDVEYAATAAQWPDDPTSGAVDHDGGSVAR